MLLLERCDCDLGSLIYPKAGSEHEGQLSAPLMMKIATEMADGLSYLHSRGIKHLDMKPGNVLLNPFTTKVVKLPTRTKNLEVELCLPSKEGS